MKFIDNLNHLLQQALNYIKEGLRQEGVDIDFQNVQNPNTQNQNYHQQAYPPHPNLDPENYPKENQE